MTARNRKPNGFGKKKQKKLFLRILPLVLASAVLAAAPPATAQTLTLSLNPASVAEDAGPTTVTVTATLEEARATATEVTVSRTGGTATSGTDYAAVGAFTVTIPAEQTSGTATFTFTPTDDSVADGDETLVLSGSATGLTPGTATLTITDDEIASTALELSLSPSALWESQASRTEITATFTLNGAPRPRRTNLQVYVRDPDPDNPQPGYIYGVWLPAGETSVTRTFTIQTFRHNNGPDPPRAWPLQAFAATRDGDGAREQLAPDTALLYIIDDDGKAITLSASPTSVAENAGATTVTVTAGLDAGTAPTATEVTMSVTGGTATSGTDHAAVESFTVTIPAGQSSGMGTFTFTPTDDSDAEGAETVVLSASATPLQPPMDLTGGTATLTITDDDSVPTDIVLSVSQNTFAETAGATPVTVTAALDAGTRGTATTVLVVLTADTATEGTDYAALGSPGFVTVTIPAEQTSGTATFTFTPTDDILREATETLFLDAAVSGNADLSDWEDTATLTITDDDAAALITLDVSPGGVWEHLGPQTITVTATLDGAPPATATTVTVSRTGGLADSGTDFAPVQDFTVTIPAEQTSGTATFTFTPIDDSEEERPEDVTLGEPVGNTVRVGLTILDDESERRPVVLRVSPRSVEEHAGATTVTVTAILAEEAVSFGQTYLEESSRALDTEVTVSVTGGTATSGTDYAVVEDFTLTIPAEQTSATATFTFTPTDDDAEEGSETVILTPSGEEGLVFSSEVARTYRSATLTIADDDTYVNANWPLKPPGLATGDRFRLLFVTAEGRAPTMAEISRYNAYVQGQAGTDRAHDAIRAYSSHFRVLGSAQDFVAESTLDYFSTTTDARDNTWTTYTDDHKGVPIYWVGGNRVADDYESFYDGGWDDEANPTDASGKVTAAEKVWTGSNSDGTTREDEELGSSTVHYGVLNSGAGGPISGGIDDDTNTDKGYYALSGVFRVGTTTVDPTGIALSVSPGSVYEDGGATTVTVTATLNLGTRTTATEVTVSRTGGTATSGTDYEAVENFTVTIPADHLSGTATFTLTPTDDDVVESADETVILSGSAAGLTGGTATLTITDDDKFTPVFPESAKARSVAENTAHGENVGAPVAATSPNNSALHYIQGGADGPLFGLRSQTGQILTSKPLDHEADDTLEVTVTAQDANGRSATVDVTITVTDVDEPPETPAPPTLVGIAADSVRVSWTAPENTGPAITDYDVRYQADGSESWIELDHVGTGLSTTITGLEAGAYAAQVRATNAEGTSGWSPSGPGTTKVPATEVASDWGLAPSGLEAGDAFRLLFVSSGTRDATSTDIGDYNTFVQTAAAAGHTDIQTYSAGFRAVASTAAVDASGNTGTAYTDDDKGPPIYWLGGAKVADDYEDFYDGKWDEEGTVRDEDGASVSYDRYDFNGSRVWTGSGQDGTESGSGDSSKALGTGSPEAGLLNFPFITTYGPLFGASAANDSEYPLYGLSEVFQIASAAAMNSAPTFANNMESRSVAENTGAGESVGAVVAASDTDVGDTLTYSLEGTDAAEFDIVSTSGQIQTKSALDHETDPSYSVTVKAEDDHGGSATVAVTITVTDVAEQPETPAAPTVAATANTTTSLDVSWTAPGRNGGPALTGYALQYRKGGSGPWNSFSHSGTGASATIGSLDVHSEYQVQVRALNGETPSAWSPTGTGSTGNSLPVFGGTPPLARSVAENTGAGESVGAVVAASDDDTGDMLTYSLEGTDAAEFDIVATSGQIQTKSALDYETDPSYSVTVKAEDGHGGSATIAVTITVTDVAEQPETPAAPTVTATAGSTTSLDVAWTAPGRNGGPELTGYALQYRKGGSGSWTEPSGTETGTSATIASLDANSEYQVQVRALNGETPSAWSPTGTGSTGENSAPTFANNMESRSVAENTGAGESVGAVVAASDTDVGDTLTYSLEGTDAAEFDIVSTSGQIQTKSALDHETDPSYSVTVKAEDDHGGSATVAVTITVTDVAEQPETPAAPTVAATANTTTSLDVSWTAPGRNGGPALTGYALQYRKGGSGPWNSFSHSGTGASATIGSLDVHSEYQVQVRALNGETPSAWSPTGTGSTGNSLPVFGGTPPLARSVAENTGAGESVGAVVAASDTDVGDTLSYSLEGTDAAEFDIVSTSGQIQTKSALDHETDPSYSVTVKAEDDHGGSATVAVTITVTDVAEQPETPAAPTVAATANTTTSLDVAWTAPGRNGGPELTGYALQYRKGGSGSWTEPSGTETGTSATIASLDANSEYQVQVRALNGETPSAWSPTGTGSTGNSLPVFGGTPPLARSVAENTGAGESVGVVVAASDTDVGDTLTYSLEGTDAAEFDIVSTSGQIQTKSALDHETDPSYSVTVKAEDDHGGSATVAVTITVTDVAEQPETPAAPTVAATAGSTTSLDVAWTAPGRNGGPELTGYKLQYRKGGSGSWTEPSGTETGTSATIASLDANSEYQVQVRALNGETPSAWSPTGTGSTRENSAPTFANNMEPRSVAENTGAGESVGAVVAASDTDVGDTLTYSLEGTDAAEFDIVSTSGQIQTKSALDHETDPSYSVTVKAEDDHGGSATVAVTITVTDVAEQPETPAAPTVAATANTTTSLDVSWTAPGRNGGPALTGYALQYRKGGSGPWNSFSHSGTGASATIGSLDVHSEYQVQVRALNGETPSAWSPTGTGSTGNSLPVFGGTPPLARSVAENTGAGESVGVVVAASDTDVGDTLTYSLEGTDAAEFDIVSTSGQIQTKSALDHETDPSYSVTVKAEDDHGGSATVAVTITVTDVAEQPETPAAPTVAATAGSTTSLDVAWTAPGRNGGPALTGYEVQYRKGSSGSWSAHSHSGTGTSTMIASLDASSDYQVQVQALNGEIPSDWSPHGGGTTGTPNRALTVGMASGTDPPVSESFTVRFSFSEPITGFNVSDIAADQDPECRDDQGDLVLCDPGIGVLETTDNRVFTTTVTPETDRVAHNYTLMLTVPADAVRSSVDNKPNEEATLEVRVAPPGVEEPISSIGLQASSGSVSVRLAWNEPTDPGGSAIIRYEYRYQEVGEAWSEWENVAAGSSGVTVGGLINGQEYVLEVRAVNALGKGGAETVQATPERRIAPPPPGGGGGGGGGGLLIPPEAPLGLMAMPGEGAVRLEWDPPESDGGTAILRYEYRLKEGRGGFGEWTPIEDSAPGEVNASGYTVGELDNGTVYVFELRAVNLVDEGPETEAVEVVMLLDRAYWSNFLAEDLQGSEAGLEHTPFGGTPRSLRLRFGAGLRFEEDELDGEGEVSAARMGSYGYRYTSQTTGELRLDYDGGEACEVRMTFRGVGTGSYSYRCGRALRGQGSFRLMGLNRAPEITSTGPFEVVENQAMVGQLEAADPDEGDEVTEYGIAGGADAELFAVDEETGELRFGEAPDYENPGDLESTEPQSGAGDNEYIVVVEVWSGEGERERKGQRAIRVRVTDEEEPPEITSTGPFEVMENTTTVGQLEAVDPDEGDEIEGYGIAGGADGALFEVVEETGELMFREAPDYETPRDVESAEPLSEAGDNEYVVVVEVWSGEGERERKGQRAIRVRVTDEEEPPEITSTGPFEVMENTTTVGQLEAVDPDEGDEIEGYGIAGGADGALFEVVEETGELMFREAPDYETPRDVESAEPLSEAGDNEYVVVVEVWSGEGERERKGQRAIRVRVTDEEEPPEITSTGPFEVMENTTTVGQVEAVDPDEGDEIGGYGKAEGADGALFAVDEETGELRFGEAPDYENPGDVESVEPLSEAGDNEYVVVVEVWSGEGERERKGQRAIRVRVTDEEEPPEAPAAPEVRAEGSDSLKVSWTEPENRGPAITDYDVRYREEGEEGYSDGGHEGTGLTVRLSGLEAETLYEVQVRAVSEEGTSEWSEPGEGRTEAEEADADDPSDFTGEDLEGRRLTLRLEGEEGAEGIVELRFGEGNRFEQIKSISPVAATRSASAASPSESTTSRTGTYTYEKTGPGLGRLGLTYDDGSYCEIRLSFAESGLGAFAFDCGGGDPQQGSFRLTTGSPFVPVILSSAGRNNSFFTSELSLTNRGEREVTLNYAYTAHIGGGSGTASDVLAAGRQRVETGALDYLRRLGILIPETGNRIGTLRVEVPMGSEVGVVVRTTTVVPDGRAGLAYPGITEEEGFTEAVYLCGLRQNGQDRSNVAFQNMGAPEEGRITLRTTVYSGEAGDAGPRVLEDVTLEPGGFHQFSGLLGGLKSVDGDRQGYVKVDRVEGRAPFYAYGVINDQANSDGSFVFPVTVSSLEGTAGQTLPVIVETSEFRSELTVTNFSEEPRTLDFEFVAEGIEADDKTAGFHMALEAGEQEIIPDVVDELRRQGVAGLGTTRGFYAGPLFVEAEDGDMSGIVIGARTGSEGEVGQYGVFYNAVPEGGAFGEVAWVDGLQQDEENRSNLALVNTGEIDDSESVFSLEIYDGETGSLVTTVTTKSIPARRWHQINGILGNYARGTTQGYIRIRKISGNNPFLAYGVVNDGGAPGERSGDGAYVSARE